MSVMKKNNKFCNAEGTGSFADRAKIDEDQRRFPVITCSWRVSLRRDLISHNLRRVKSHMFHILIATTSNSALKYKSEYVFRI
jgi:hypothetical protein